MARLKHILEYAIASTGSVLARVLSPRLAYGLGSGLGDLARVVASSRRRLAAENIRRCFGDRFSDTEIDQIVRNVFRNIGRAFVDFARVPKLGADGVAAMIDDNGTGDLVRNNCRGNGLVFVTAHFGSWEMVGAWIGIQGIKTNILVYRQHNPKVNGLVNDLRTSLGAGVLEVPAQTKEVFRTLRDNGIAAIACDQHAPAGTLVMDFLGRPAAVARGPALFAVRRNCPIVAAVLERTGYNSHRLHPADPIQPPNSGDEDDDVRAMTAAWVSHFEKQIRAHPDLWMWTHNRWKLPDS